MLVRIILTTVTYLLHISLEFVVNTTVSDDIILQWGTVTVTTGVADDNKISEGAVVFTFPTAFTSAPWAIFTGALDTTNVRLESASIYSNTPTNVVLYLHALGIANVKLSSFVLAIGK